MNYADFLKLIDNVFVLWRKCWQFDALKERFDPFSIGHNEIDPEREKAYDEARKAIAELAKTYEE